MSMYSKELFAATDTPVDTATPQASTNTACCNHDASGKLSSAVAMTIVEGYVMFRAKNKSLAGVEDAMRFLSDFTKQFIDNGDMTLADLEVIKDHVKAKAYMFTDHGCCCKDKLIGKILVNCACVASECDSDALKKVIDKKHEFEIAKREAMSSFGPAIQSSINQFINRYGRGFDESYINEWKATASI